MENEQPLTKRQKRDLAKEKKRKKREQQITYSKLKNIFITAFGVFVLVFLGFKVVNWIKTPQPEVAGEAIKVSDQEWVKGNVQASVTLIEYSDFECPACKNYASIVKRLGEEFPDDLRVAYRHFPLITNHKNAAPAARAAEAAGKQDKFWEMHDMLFEKQEDWSSERNPKDKFVSYVKELGLDEGRFIEDFESGQVEEEVNKDLSSAIGLGLNSTPTFFLNGEKIQPRSYEEFKVLVENQIQ